jgi:hypothetical protein
MDDESEDRERVGGIEEPPVPEEPKEPEYTPEEYQLAQQIKAHRLYKEEHGRIPYTRSELSHFLIKATNIERPLKPDEDDLKAARQRLEEAGS